MTDKIPEDLQWQYERFGAASLHGEYNWARTLIERIAALEAENERLGKLLDDLSTEERESHGIESQLAQPLREITQERDALKAQVERLKADLTKIVNQFEPQALAARASQKEKP